jgi:hypothetical protein
MARWRIPRMKVVRTRIPRIPRMEAAVVQPEAIPAATPVMTGTIKVERGRRKV